MTHDVSSHLTRITSALERLERSNRQPAIEEPANDFESAVNDWHDLQDLLSEVKSLLKPLEADERKLRDGISESLVTFFGAGLKEGVNDYELSNGRKLKYAHKMTRSVDAALVPVAREAYEEAIINNDDARAPLFDDLIRTKYELEKRVWNKLSPGSEVFNAASRMIETKRAAPTLEVD